MSSCQTLRVSPAPRLLTCIDREAVPDRIRMALDAFFETVTCQVTDSGDSAPIPHPPLLRNALIARAADS